MQDTLVGRLAALAAALLVGATGAALASAAPGVQSPGLRKPPTPSAAPARRPAVPAAHGSALARAEARRAVIEAEGRRRLEASMALFAAAADVVLDPARD